MVLAYPENLGRADFERNPMPRQVQRFDLSNQVDAKFLVDVQPAGQYFIYRYRVSNSKKAKQGIGAFDITVPVFDNDDSIAAPDDWLVGAIPSQINAVRRAIGEPSGVFLRWSSQNWKTSLITPGTELGGFEVTSIRKPGFTLAYVQGGVPHPGLSSQMPRVVLEQTIPVMQKEYYSQNVLTIAPKFSIDTPIADIATDFISGINQLVAQGQLDGNALAVKEALRGLQHYLQPSRSRPVFSTKPQPGLEAAIINAMKLSLKDY